jgi:hypothetical protein
MWGAVELSLSLVVVGTPGGRQVSQARAVFYKQRERKESRDVRSDLAAKQYAARMGYDSIEIQSVFGGPSPRYYILSQAEGRRWMGPWEDEYWSYIYLRAHQREEEG